VISKAPIARESSDSGQNDPHSKRLRSCHARKGAGTSSKPSNWYNPLAISMSARLANSTPYGNNPESKLCYDDKGFDKNILTMLTDLR